MTWLAAHRLSVAIGDRALVNDLNVAFNAGEVWAILGANGSGKTTLLHTLAGLRASTAGHVTLEDRPLADWPPRQRARRIAVLLQEYDPSFPETTLDYAMSARHPHRHLLDWTDDADRALALAALDATELAPLAARPVATLSGGERRRLEIATVLAQATPISLLDEPANHLDFRHQMQLLRRCTDAARRGEGLVLLALHDINLAARLATHALLLFGDGRTLHGPINTVLSLDNLARLYGCAFHELRDGAHRCFLPA